MRSVGAVSASVQFATIGDDHLGMRIVAAKNHAASFLAAQLKTFLLKRLQTIAAGDTRKFAHTAPCKVSNLSSEPATDPLPGFFLGFGAMGTGLIFAPLLARRNWNLGRADRKGALRVAIARLAFKMLFLGVCGASGAF